MGAHVILVRHEHWPSLLAAYLADDRPFAWGGRDCCTFAAGAVEAMTGADPAAALRGRYRTEQGAARLLKRHGGLEALAARLAREHGLRDVPHAFAGRGDVVLIETGQGPALGVIDLAGRIAAQGPDGITWHDAGIARRAWKVG